jgi:hypothetical protein
MAPPTLLFHRFVSFSDDLATRLWRSLAVAGAFAFTVFLLIPLGLYFPQLPQFGSSPYEIVPLLLAASLLCIALVVLGMLALPRKAHPHALYLVFSLGVLAWLQGDVLVGSYGVLDGTPIQWAALPSALYLDLALWLIVVPLGMTLARGFSRHAAGISVIFIAMQLVGVAVAAHRAPVAFKDSPQQQVSKDFFEFSERQNVLLVVLDSYQADLFEEILQEHPEYESDFDGFTFYRNAVGGFSTTRPMLALILTGAYYQNEQPLNDFLLSAYTGRSISRVLKERGFRVGIARNERGIQLMYCDRRLADSCVRLQELASRNPPPLREAVRLYDLALFRMAPHAAKPWIYNDGKWRLGSGLSGMYVPGMHGEDIRFIEILSERARRNASERGTFKFLHLLTPHPPFVMDEDLRPATLGYSRQAFKRQSVGALRLVKNILSALERIGVYDDTMIMVLGDHGSRKGIWVNVGLLGLVATRGKDAAFQNVKSSGLPLVLVKPFGSRGPLRVSDAPISLGDVAKTIAAEVGIQADLPGESMLEIAEDAERERRFFHYQGFDWKTPFPTMKEYRINGFSWLDESWHDTSRILDAGYARKDGSRASVQ